MKTSIKQGFTLIELLVVIAIIGILAGILFVAIDPSNQTSKASLSSMKASMGAISGPALIAYDNAGFSHATVCAQTSIDQAISALDAEVSISAECNNNSAAYAAFATGFGETFCVDSTGFKGNATPTTGATVCN